VIITEVTPAEPARFALWHTALTKGAVADRPGADVDTLDAFVESVGNPSPLRRRRAFAAIPNSGDALHLRCFARAVDAPQGRARHHAQALSSRATRAVALRGALVRAETVEGTLAAAFRHLVSPCRTAGPQNGI
jgi:hypothetical protein